MIYKLIGFGAEAMVFYIEKEKNEIIDKSLFKKITGYNIDKEISINKEKFILKFRFPKDYLNKEIAQQLREYRTKLESKIMKKLYGIINVPEIYYEDYENGIIIMQYIDGNILTNILNDNNKEKLLYDVGYMIGKMHEKNIVHGDLTTHNFILDNNNNLYIIDFGLSFYSHRIEDFAVDLELLKKLLENRFWYINNSFDYLIKGYKESFKLSDDVINRIKDIEMRGRYKSVIS